MTIHCGYDGTEHPDDANYCIKYGHALRAEHDHTRIDAVVQTPSHLVGSLEVRIGQMMSDPLARIVAVRWGLGGAFVVDVGTVTETVPDIVGTLMRRLWWAIGCALVCFVVFRATSGESSPLWLAATCLLYLGAAGIVTRFDRRYSQGLSGPPPPETYS